MNSGLLLPALAAALLVLPGAAWADRNPDFENDALPILQHQPGLAEYVHAHYVIKETGAAQSPGSDNQAPRPPYIFSAKPRGASGPFYLRLLIQPGPAGHILKVADIRGLHGQVPANETVPGETAPSASVTQASVPASAPTGTSNAAPVSSSTQPSSDTPSGPIHD